MKDEGRSMDRWRRLELKSGRERKLVATAIAYQDLPTEIGRSRFGTARRKEGGREVEKVVVKGLSVNSLAPGGFRKLLAKVQFFLPVVLIYHLEEFSLFISINKKIIFFS